MAQLSSSQLRQRTQDDPSRGEFIEPFQQHHANPKLMLNRPIYNERTFKDIFPEKSPSTNSKTSIRKLIKFKGLKVESLKKFVFHAVPILYWLPKYNIKSYLLEDCISGFTVGILRIPHGMAHAVLATLSPVYGLYTNIFPQLIYTFFGTSRHISIGTMAVISIMVGDAIEKAYQEIHKEGSLPPTVDAKLERAKIASSLSIMVGLIQFVMCFLQVGVITNYLPEPLVRGFTTGAACHVFASQFNHLFGIDLERYTGPFSLIKSYQPFFPQLRSTNPTTLIVSLVALITLVVVKEVQDHFKDRFKWQLPIEMFVVAFGAVASYFLKFEDKKVVTVGEIPSGLPPIHIPSITYASILLTDAIILSIVSYALVISLANIFAKKHKYEVYANQASLLHPCNRELFAFGASHVLSSLLYCYPTTSSLSRTLVKDIAGGKSMIAGVVSTLLVLLVVLVLGRFLEPLPVCCLAAIIVVALRGMFRQLLDIKVLWRYSKIDMTIWLVTVVSTILLGLDFGLAIGVGFSVFTVVLRSQRPNCTTLGQFGETGLYGDVKMYEDAKQIPGIRIVRIQSPFYFANAAFIKNTLKMDGRKSEEMVNKEENNGEEDGVVVSNHNNRYTTFELEALQSNHTASGNHASNNHRSVDGPSQHEIQKSVHSIILDFSAVSFVDTVALNTLETIAEDYTSYNIKLCLAECRGTVQEMIFKSGLVKSIDLDQIFLSVHDAVLYILSQDQATPEVHLLENREIETVSLRVEDSNAEAVC
ncbi:Prestin [Holothuria leucospilota]|uniref:Prestin n=1 Tax=Holothuria leucospilota TaxID=206669 RepID=A0A9Q1CK83_HOLLE|nr:Prestin [Holothuria leucospilota]